VIDPEEGALGGIVHGAIAARFGDADIFDRPVAVDGECDGGFGTTSSADVACDTGGGAFS